MNPITQIFQPSIDKTYRILRELMKRAQIDHERQAFQILRAALHVIRDRITPSEAMQFAAQLPLVLKGTFYEGYRWSSCPIPITTKKNFLLYFLWKCGRPNGSLEEAERLFRITLHCLEQSISPGEMNDVRAQLPAALKNLFESGNAKESAPAPTDELPLSSAEIPSEDAFDLNAEELQRANAMRDRLIHKEGFTEEQANSIVLFKTGKALGTIDSDLFNAQIRSEP